MSGAVAQALWLRSQKFVHSFFSLGLGHDSLKFSNRNFGKKIWEKIFPQGGVTPKIFTKALIPPLWQCACKISSPYVKNCGLQRVPKRPDRETKKKQGRRCPAQTGSPVALTLVPLDRPAGTKLVTWYCSAPSLPVFAQSAKNRVFRGNFLEYKNNKVRTSVKPSTAP